MSRSLVSQRVALGVVLLLSAGLACRTLAAGEGPEGGENRGQTAPREPVTSRAAALLVCVLTAGIARAGQPAEKGPSPRGFPVPELAALDRLLPPLMEKWRLPGGAVAIAKDGRLMVARGYGLAEVPKRRPVEPDSLFRIASLSKPITAAAILVLVEQGRLRLDARALDLLGPVEPPAGKSLDPRFGRITVRQLLQHTGGFDRQVSSDPMFRSIDVAGDLGVAPPAGPAAILRWMLGRPLDFEPGARYAYSNFGYCVLGRILERASGRSYEAAVKSLVLEPAGIERMRLGRSKAAGRFPGEVGYYPQSGAKPGRSVFPDDRAPVPPPYGTFSIEAMDAHGGWIASAVDLVRFVTALDGTRKPALLKPDTFALIPASPNPKIEPDHATRYGLGWSLHPTGKGMNWSHTGSLPGTTAILVRTHDRMTWAALFNSRPADPDALLLDLDRTLWEAIRQVSRWPDHDLFGQYR